MKTQRWMKAVLVAAQKEQIEMPWSRAKRAEGRAEKPAQLEAAE